MAPSLTQSHHRYNQNPGIQVRNKGYGFSYTDLEMLLYPPNLIFFPDLVVMSGRMSLSQMLSWLIPATTETSLDSLS